MERVQQEIPGTFITAGVVILVCVVLRNIANKKKKDKSTEILEQVRQKVALAAIARARTETQPNKSDEPRKYQRNKEKTERKPVSSLTTAFPRNQQMIVDNESRQMSKRKTPARPVLTQGTTEPRLRPNSQQDESIKGAPKRNSPARQQLRQATEAQHIAWKEEKTSQEQFGFSIYGHKPSDHCCSECNKSDSNSINEEDYSRLPTGFNAIQSLSTVPGLPGEPQALALLQQLSQEYEPVARRRGYSVLKLTELCCCSKFSKPTNVGGFCISVGNGRVAKSIHIRLRPPGSCRNGARFYPYQTLVEVMAHELSHIEISPHNDAFFRLMGEILEERAKFLVHGGTKGSGLDGSSFFLTAGRRLGTASGFSPVLGSRELRQRVADSAARRLEESKIQSKTG